ncbi:hypothetical protein ACKRZS_003360 [Fusarium odoratissimum]
MSDAQSNKRRASGRHEDEPAKKRGRPSKEVLNSKVPENSMSRVQAQGMLSRHPPLSYTSQQESWFYDELVPWPAQHDWDEEDSAAIDEEWNQSELKESSSRLNTSQYASLFLLFKISLRLYRTTPIVLLSPICAMRYQAVSKNHFCNEWIMSGKFCNVLSSLMVHPCWEENIDSLALALRWTVICRLDSRSAWAADVKFSCSVLQRIFDKIKEYQGESLNISYHEMHKAERDRASGRDEPPSTLSDILYEVGEAVPKDNTVMPKADPKYNSVFGWSVLPVTVWDLKILAKVVNSMDFKPEWNYSVEDALSAWKVENSGPELPPQDRLSVIYSHSQKSVFRHLRLVDRQLSSVQGTEEAKDDENQRSDPFSSSDDNGSQLDTSSSHHQRRRRAVVDDSSDKESESVSETTGPLPKLRRRHAVTNAEDEDSAPVRSGDSDLPFHPLPDLEDEEGDDDMTGTFNAGANLDFGEFLPRATNESDEFRPRGPTLAESLPPQPPASPIYASLREQKMLSELSELRKENRELREGQEKLRGLFAEGVKRQNEVIAQSSNLLLQVQKEQKELLLNMQKQLESMQSELSELRQAKEAPNRGDRPPEVTVTSDSAPKSPELGTIPSALHNDVVSLEEATVVEPMDEDIPPEQAVPKEKTPEPETSDQQVVIASEALQSAPEHGTPKQKTPEPEPSERQGEPVQEQHGEPVTTKPNPLKEGEDRTHVASQLSEPSHQTLNPRTVVKISSQNLTKDSLRGLAKRPDKRERRIGSMRGLVSAQTPILSVQRSIFMTPRSELLKMWKKTE